MYKALVIANSFLRKARFENNGIRVKRGLFKTKNNFYINADVNGSINILSKAIGIGILPDQIKGILVYPLKIRVS